MFFLPENLNVAKSYHAHNKKAPPLHSGGAFHSFKQRGLKGNPLCVITN